MQENYEGNQREGDDDGEGEEAQDKKAGSGSDEKSEKSQKSHDSRKSVPGLTGNTHIIMRRDFDNKYELEQNGDKLKLSDTHFQPIFFAKNTNQLRNEPSACNALKKFRIFVKPDDMHDELLKQPPPPMIYAQNLQMKLKKEEEED